MADQIYSAAQVIGKSLIAKTKINIRRLPSQTAEILSVTKPGQTVGKVYSYVEKEGFIWWQLNNEKGPWVAHKAGWYSITALKSQGAKTVEQEIEEKQENEKTITDKLSDFFSPTGAIVKYGLPIALILGGFLVVDRLLPAKKQSYA